MMYYRERHSISAYFIELLNIAFQNPGRTILQIMDAEGFEFSKDSIMDDEIHKDFAGFEV